MYGWKPFIQSIYFGTQKADMNATTTTKFEQLLHKRLKWANKTVQHVIEKKNKRHKKNYNHEIRCNHLRVGDMVPLKRTAFKGKH